MFNIPIMGCMNSIAYLQRQIDKVLRSIRDFAHAYIDDIVTGAEDFQQHVAHLQRLFQLLSKYNIAIAPTKTFLNYPNINLLGRKVDLFDMATAEDKLKAISEIAYPTTLGNLEHYLGLTCYLRNHVHYYAQLSSPLQALKTLLLNNQGSQRRLFSSRQRLPRASPKKNKASRAFKRP